MTLGRESMNDENDVIGSASEFIRGNAKIDNNKRLIKFHVY